MYFQQAEHNPPHVHAIYGEHMAAIGIRNGEILEGSLPPREMAVAISWVRRHEAQLLHMWQSQEFARLDAKE